MNTKQPDIAHLLRDVANEIRESATYPPLHTWEDGHAMDARAAHDEYLAAAEAVEALIAKNETLHAENETLRTGLDAARLEIESLKGQLEAVRAGEVSPLIGVSQEPMFWVRLLQDGLYQEPVHNTKFKRDRDEMTGAWSPLYPHPAQPAAQALDSVRVFWQQHTQADALSMTMAELHDDVELVIRAARGAAQAAPVDAAVQQDAERLDFMIESCTQVATISPRGRKYLCYPDGRMQAGSYPTARAAIDAARAAQKGTND